MLVESYTGAIFTDILGIDYYNAFQNISAVGLRLAEPGTEQVPAVLVGAHFDSSLGTPGATCSTTGQPAELSQLRSAWSCLGAMSCRGGDCSCPTRLPAGLTASALSVLRCRKVAGHELQPAPPCLHAACCASSTDSCAEASWCARPPLEMSLKIAATTTYMAHRGLGLRQLHWGGTRGCAGPGSRPHRTPARAGHLPAERGRGDILPGRRRLCAGKTSRPVQRAWLISMLLPAPAAQPVQGKTRQVQVSSQPG